MSSQTCTQSLVMSSLTHLHPTRITSSATSLEANCSEETHNFPHTFLLFFLISNISYQLHTPILLIDWLLSHYTTSNYPPPISSTTILVFLKHSLHFYNILPTLTVPPELSIHSQNHISFTFHITTQGLLPIYSHTQRISTSFLHAFFTDD